LLKEKLGRFGQFSAAKIYGDKRGFIRGRLLKRGSNAEFSTGLQ
jgi:hypothetical protein